MSGAKRRRLRKLQINRVDLVDRGAAQYADVVLFKRDGAEDLDKARPNFAKPTPEGKVNCKACKGSGKVDFGKKCDTCDGKGYTDPTAKGYYVGTVTSTSSTATTGGILPPGTIFTYTLPNGTTPLDKQQEPTMPAQDDKALIDLQAHIDAVVSKAVADTTAIFAAQYVAEQEAFTKAVEAAKDADLPIEKRADLPEDVRKALADAKAEREAVEKRLADIEGERIAERMTGIAKALPFIGSTDEPDGDSSAELAKLLTEVSKAVEPKQFDAIVALLTEAQSTIAKSVLLSELGRGEGVTTSAEAEVEKRAAALRVADPSLSEPQAIAKALQADPALYARHEHELRQG